MGLSCGRVEHAARTYGNRMKGRQVAELQGRVNNAGLSSVAPLLDADIVLAQSKESAMAQHISYRTVKVDGLSIFYREAGPKDAPTILHSAASRTSVVVEHVRTAAHAAGGPVSRSLNGGSVL